MEVMNVREKSQETATGTTLLNPQKNRFTISLLKRVWFFIRRRILGGTECWINTYAPAIHYFTENFV